MTETRPRTSGRQTSGPKTSVPEASGPRTSGPETSGPKTRSYAYDPAPFDPGLAMSMSGLDYLTGVMEGRIGARPPIGATMGFSAASEIAHGRVAFEGAPEDFVLNPIGIVHGGWAATLLDSAMGCAVHSALAAGVGYSTAELKINYTRAIRPGQGVLRAEGRVIHVGRRMATAEGRLTGAEDGKLYAHGSTTCFLFPLGAEG